MEEIWRENKSKDDYKKGSQLWIPDSKRKKCSEIGLLIAFHGVIVNREASTVARPFNTVER